MPAATTEAPAVALSCMCSRRVLRLTFISDLFAVANNFWGKDDAGVHPLLDRMGAAKQTNDELKSFYSGKTRSCKLVSAESLR